MKLILTTSRGGGAYPVFIKEQLYIAFAGYCMSEILAVNIFSLSMAVTASNLMKTHGHY